VNVKGRAIPPLRFLGRIALIGFGDDWRADNREFGYGLLAFSDDDFMIAVERGQYSKTKKGDNARNVIALFSFRLNVSLEAAIHAAARRHRHR
jgi:hypothetical protein